MKRFLIEFAPLLTFFGVNYLRENIYEATGAFMAVTVISLILSKRLLGKIAPGLSISSVVVIVFGGLTLLLNDELFIKLKPTIVNSMFASILFFGLWRGQNYLKLLFEEAFPPITQRGWTLLTVRWACFFIFLALLNEVIHRSFSTDFWVAFKVWGNMPLTIGFALFQLGLMNKHLVKEDDEAAAEPAE